MAARNPDSVSNQGQFHARRPREDHGHMGEHQHHIGVKSSPYDQIPVAHVQKLPPGTAPPEHTFEPHNDFNIRAQDAWEGNEGPLVDPLDFTGAADSRSVHRGIGKPMQGMTSLERHHEGRPGRGKQPVGPVKYGESSMGAGGRGVVELGGVDARDPKFANQRGIRKWDTPPDIVPGTRGNKGEKLAEDLPPETC